MEPLIIEGTQKIPTVNFNADTGKLEIKGRSIPEDSIGFYKPMMDWLESYADNAQPNTELSMFMEYFNTSSSKCILDVLKSVAKFDSEVKVKWQYEEDDEDMLEAGEDYDAIVDLPFEMIEVPE